MELLTFTQSNGDFAIPVEQIDELLPIMSIQSIPDLPHFIEGVINLRGKVLPVVDMVEKLGGRRATPPPPVTNAEPVLTHFTKNTRLVVTMQQGHSLAVIVDGVAGIETFDHSDIHENIITEDAHPAHLKGMIMFEGKMIQIIAIDQLLSEVELSQLVERDKNLSGENMSDSGVVVVPKDDTNLGHARY